MNKFGKIVFLFFALSLIIIGIYVRLNIYLADRPMGWDEMCLSFNITNHPPLEVFKSVAESQKCPTLFIFFTNIITMIFGVNTFSLRFFPLISGIGTFFAGYCVSKKMFQSKLPIILFLSFIAFCFPLVYYSSEFKPYSSDVLVFLLLILMYDKFDFNKMPVKKAVLYGFITLLLCQFSFPAMFCITAIIITKMIENKKIYFKAIFPLLAVICSGLYSMWLFRNIMDFEIHNEHEWQRGLLNISFESFNNMLSDFFQFIYVDYRFGTCFLICGLITFLIQKNKYAICMLVCFLIACVASLFHVYPLTGRIMLYLIPAFALFILKPIDIVINDENKKERLIAITKSVLLSAILCLSFYVINIFDLESLDYTNKVKERQIYKNFLKQYNNDKKIFYNAKSYTYLTYYINTERDFKEIKLPDYISAIPESGEPYYNVLSEAIKDKTDFLFVDINLNEEQIERIEQICRENNAKISIFNSMDRLTIYKFDYN